MFVNLYQIAKVSSNLADDKLKEKIQENIDRTKDKQIESLPLRAALSALSNSDVRKEYNRIMLKYERGGEQKQKKPQPKKKTKSKTKKKLTKKEKRELKKKKERLQQSSTVVLKKEEEKIPFSSNILLEHASIELYILNLQKEGIKLVREGYIKEEELDDYIFDVFYSNINETLLKEIARDTSHFDVKLPSDYFNIKRWKDRYYRVGEVVKKLGAGYHLPEPKDVKELKSNLEEMSVQELQKYVLASAITMGEFPLAKQFFNSQTFLQLDFWRSQVEVDLIDTEEFRNALKILEREEVKNGKVHISGLEELGFRALEAGKVHFAIYSFNSLGIRYAIEYLLRLWAYKFLAKEEFEKSALAFINSAELNKPGGPFVHDIVMDLHNECLSKPGSCPSMSSPIETAQLINKYLLNEVYWIEWLNNILTAEDKLKIAMAIGISRDFDFNYFKENYDKAYKMYADFTSSHSSFDEEELEELGKNISSQLLGRTPLNPEFYQFMRELAYEHPMSAFFICVRPFGKQLFIVPLPYQNQNKLDLFVKQSKQSR